MCLVQTVSDKLSTWLNYECRSRGWSHRQLGDRSGISGAMISRVIAEKQSAGWDFCKAMADTLGKDPVEVFRMAGLLPEESHGEDEPALLHHYRQLSPGNQLAALAMLRGLAGQPSPPAQPPAKGADIDDVCRLLARLDSGRLQQAAGFIRWLIEQPETTGAARPVTWEDVKAYFASLSPETLETVLTNAIRQFGPVAKNPDVFGDIRSQPDQESGPAPHQGTLF